MTALADSYKLEINFPTSASFGNALLLDDAASGLLDTGKLGGDAWADVTSDIQQITASKGRSRQLDTFQSSTLSFTLKNNARGYDPTNTAGIYFGGLVPRRPIRFTTNSTYVFYGWIDDININYDQPTNSVVTMSCVDAFSVLASISIQLRIMSNGQRADLRIAEVLALPEVGSPVTTSLEIANETLGDDTIAEGTTVLDYLQQINRSEQGYLFVAGDGTLTFYARNTALAFGVASAPVFVDSAPAIGEFRYTAISVQFGTELLYNRIVTQNTEGGTAQTAENLTSQSDYLVRTLAINDMLLQTDAQALGIANYLLAKYDTPQFRYDSVTVSMSGLSTADQNTLLGIEIADIVQVKRTFAVGTPLVVSKYASVEGISHSITLTEHTIVFNLSTSTDITNLRLDNALFGLLDSSTLGF